MRNSSALPLLLPFGLVDLRDRRDPHPHVSQFGVRIRLVVQVAFDPAKIHRQGVAVLVGDQIKGHARLQERPRMRERLVPQRFGVVELPQTAADRGVYLPLLERVESVVRLHVPEVV